MRVSRCLILFAIACDSPGSSLLGAHGATMPRLVLHTAGPTHTRLVEAIAGNEWLLVVIASTKTTDVLFQASFGSEPGLVLHASKSVRVTNGFELGNPVSVDDGELHAVTLQLRSTDARLRVDGNSVRMRTPIPAQMFTRLAIEGSVAEVLFWEGTSGTRAELDSLDDYVRAKYGLEL